MLGVFVGEHETCDLVLGSEHPVSLMEVDALYDRYSNSYLMADVLLKMSMKVRGKEDGSGG